MLRTCAGHRIAGSPGSVSAPLRPVSERERVVPPFDHRVGHARLREVMRQRFRLGGGGGGKAVAQNLRHAAMQDLPAALGKRRRDSARASI